MGTLRLLLPLVLALPLGAQDAVDLDWWSRRTSSQGVESLTLAGEGEYLRLADTTSGYVEGEIDFGLPFLTIREWVYGITAAAGEMPPGEVVRVLVGGSPISEFSGLAAGDTAFDTLTAWGLAGNSTILTYRIEFESPSPRASDHALFLRGRAVKRAFDVAIGSNQCALSPNSAGPGVFLVAVGSRSVTTNDFTLVASGAPPGAFALFLYAPQNTRVPFGEGYLCLAGGSVGLVRLGPPAATSPSGQLSRRVDFTAPPAGSGPTAILGGSTWSFQLWFRDGASFNTSESLRVPFQP